MSRCRWSGCESLERRRLLAAGAPDPSFSSDGEATAPGFGVAVTATAAAVQLDGRTVVAGYSADKRFAVARYNVDGSLDTTFGPTFNGTVLTAFGHGTFAHAVAVQDDGKIVVAGGFADGVDVARYNPDGTLDLAFNSDGRETFNDFGYNDYHAVATALALLPRQSLDTPQRILVGGSLKHGSLITEINYDFFFLRLNGTSGSLDDSFGDDGHRFVGFGDEDRLAAMAVDYSLPASDPRHGSIVGVGAKDDESVDHPGTYSELAVVRLTPNGFVDTTFDGDGKAVVTGAPNVRTAATGIVIQGGGKYVVGGTAGADFAMARFLPTGALDPSFGASGSGWVRTDMGGIERGTDLTRSYEGGLILGGTSETGPVGQPTVTRAAFAAFTGDGMLDPRFGTAGRWTASFRDGGRFATGPGRRFVVAGGPSMHAARFLDVGANLVRAAAIDPLAYEQFQNTATFAVYRSERLPVATRVYFDPFGTANPPGRVIRGDPDYSGISRPVFGGYSSYVDIPAGETVVMVTVTPAQDLEAEGNEIASFALQPDGTYELGSPSVVSVTIVDDDAPPPGPAEVYVRSSAWAGADADPGNVTFMEYLKAAGLGHERYGYRTDDKPAGDVLPWTNLDEILVHYTSPPVLAGAPPGSTIVLDGVRGDYAVTEIITLDPETFALRIGRPLGGSPATAQTNGDRIHFALPGGGGYYHYDLNVLQGDVDRSGTVVAADFSEVKKKFFRSAVAPGPAGATGYTPFHDVDGNGSIVANDFSEVKKRFFHSLPSAGGLPPAGASAGSTSITLSLLGPQRRLSPRGRQVIA